MDDVLKVKWYLVEMNETVISVQGYPETFYACYISTSPEKGKGYKLATLQRWSGGPQYNGFVEQAIGREIVAAHNASLEKKKEPATADFPSTILPTVPTEEKLKGKPGPKKGHMPGNLKNLVRWPKGIARKQPDGRLLTLKEALELKRLQDEKATQVQEFQILSGVESPTVTEDQGNRIIQQEQPVQAETHPPQEKIQSQALSTSAIGTVTEDQPNVLPSPLLINNG